MSCLGLFGSGNVLACIAITVRGQATALMIFPRLSGSASVGGGVGFLVPWLTVRQREGGYLPAVGLMVLNQRGVLTCRGVDGAKPGGRGVLTSCV